jgi:tetratricopeptide (TPR) repeat protein
LGYRLTNFPGSKMSFYPMEIVVFVVLCILANIGVCSAEQATFQTTNGPCAINIANNSGTIKIESKCLDPNVTKLFVETLNRQDRKYEEKERELRQFMNRYFALLERLGVTGAFTELREEVRKHYEGGDLDGAGQIEEEIISKEESTVDLLAADYYDRAEMLVLQLKPLEAQHFYAKAFQYRPNVPIYAEGYAQNLCNTGNVDRAEEIYQKSIRELQDLFQMEPEKYAADLSCSLIDLAALYYGTGDYKSALAESEEALSIARSIIPKDEDAALEHQADALQGLGAAKAKMGDLKGARSDLLAADKLYDGLLTPSQNRPGIYEVLADISKQESNFDEQVKGLVRAVELQEELLPRFPLARRGQLARETLDLCNFYLDRKEVDKAKDTIKEFADFVAGLSDVEPSTIEFLSAVASEIKGNLDLRSGDLSAAPAELGVAIEKLAAIESGLRTRESGMFGLAHFLMAWVHIQEGDYKAAADSLERSTKVNKYPDGPEFARTERSSRLLDFFIKDFSTAAKEFLAHADDIPRAHRTIWEFLVRKREDASANLEGPPLEDADDFAIELADVFNGRSPTGALESVVKQVQNEKSIEVRCGKLFFVGESYLLLGDRKNGLQVMTLCSPPTYDTFYPWVMKAEIINWTH